VFTGLNNLNISTKTKINACENTHHMHMYKNVMVQAIQFKKGHGTK